MIAFRVVVGNRALDLSRLTVLFAPMNRARFAFRRALGFRRGAPAISREPLATLFDYLEGDLRADAEARAKALRTTYPLDAALERCTRVAARENLYVLDLLDAWAAPHVSTAESFRVVDVGSKDFVYAAALRAFASHHVREECKNEKDAIAVTGVEIDGHVVYRDFRSRADYANAWAAIAGEGTSYVVSDFLAFESPKAMLVTIFYPFVTRFALLRWGLPAGEYKPDALLTHAVQMLAREGVLVIVNHTHEERDLLRRLMSAIPDVKLVAKGDVTSRLVDYWEDVAERSISVYLRS